MSKSTKTVFDPEMAAARAQAQAIAAAASDAAKPATKPVKPRKVPPVLYPLNVRLTLTARKRIREGAHVARCSEQEFIQRFAMTLPPGPGERLRTD